MRRCLHCGSVSADDESICGVCGASLEKAAFVDLHQVAGATPQPVNPKPPNRKAAFAFLAVVLGLAGSAVASSFFVGALGLALFLPMLFVIVIAIDIFSSEGLRPLFFGRRKAILRFSYGRGSADAMSREADREEQEQRDRESGAAD